ncbi:FliH/SctL family protein [Roseiconus lacunae]|uniref:FliH/SctL family protein n=1 Tax=Roseiconus lacunae TaxID=2605694 RepID=UPI0011F26EAB|nr:FliH/SctL family protein [Roseiconus lacunae]MCD0459816.1 hypothetical protein [Roseiconus lacunae]
MAVIQIPFPNNLANVSTSHGRVTQQTTTSVDNGKAELAEAINAVTAAIETIREDRQQQFATMTNKLIATACQIAREALGEENELLDKRVKHFTETLLGELQESKDATIFVHPSVIKSLAENDLIAQNDAVEIVPDATVAAGDCRVEIDGKGLLASLDAYLDAASLRLRQQAGGDR